MYNNTNQNPGDLITIEKLQQINDTLDELEDNFNHSLSYGWDQTRQITDNNKYENGTAVKIVQTNLGSASKYLSFSVEQSLTEDQRMQVFKNLGINSSLLSYLIEQNLSADEQKNARRNLGIEGAFLSYDEQNLSNSSKNCGRDNIDAVCPNILTPLQKQSDCPYQNGAYIIYNNKLYQSLIDDNNSNPDTQPEAQKLITFEEGALTKSKLNTVLNKTLNDFISRNNDSESCRTMTGDLILANGQKENAIIFNMPFAANAKPTSTYSSYINAQFNDVEYGGIRFETYKDQQNSMQLFARSNSNNYTKIQLTVPSTQNTDYVITVPNKTGTILLDQDLKASNHGRVLQASAGKVKSSGGLNKKITGKTQSQLCSLQLPAGTQLLIGQIQASQGAQGRFKIGDKMLPGSTNSTQYEDSKGIGSQVVNLYKTTSTKTLSLYAAPVKYDDSVTLYGGFIYAIGLN